MEKDFLVYIDDILKTKWFSELELHVIDHSLTFVL